MNQLDKTLYTGRTHTIGGRDGSARSSDGALDVKLSPPGFGNGTNPEQMFAAGWSACFLGAIGAVAQQLKVKLPAERTVDAEVDLVSNGEGYSLRARLNINLPGLDREIAEQVVTAAHQTCPYSKATRGNIPVEINLV